MRALGRYPPFFDWSRLIIHEKTVYGVFLSEVFQSFLVADTVWDILIENWGGLNPFGRTPWSSAVIPGMNGIGGSRLVPASSPHQGGIQSPVLSKFSSLGKLNLLSHQLYLILANV